MTRQITIRPSGHVFQAQDGETVLEAALREGYMLPYGCRNGACGSCKSKKLEGTVNHGPHQSKALSPEEEAAGFVLTCCAQAQSDLELESRQVTELGALPIKKMPTRVISLVKKSDDVMVLQLQMPANDSFITHSHGQAPSSAVREDRWRETHLGRLLGHSMRRFDARVLSLMAHNEQVPLALSKEFPLLNCSLSSRNLLTALLVDSAATLA